MCSVYIVILSSTAFQFVDRDSDNPGNSGWSFGGVLCGGTDYRKHTKCLSVCNGNYSVYFYSAVLALSCSV